MTKRHRRWVVGLLAAVLVIGSAVVVLAATHRSTDGRVDGAVASASSTAVGADPQDVVSARRSSTGHGWQSNGETVGAWIELQWPGQHALRRVVIVRNALDQPGITAGFLTFSDGSEQQLRLSTSSTRTVVPVAERSVDRMRFTVTEVSAGAGSVALSRLDAYDRAGPQDVATDAPADGDVAPFASVSQDTAAGGTDPRGLLSSAASPPGWTVPRPAGAWVQLTWAEPRELSTVEVSGNAASSAALRSATLTFSDGSRLTLGAVTKSPGRPTRISFMPRVTTSLRLRVDAVDGTGSLVLSALRAYQQGASLGTLATGGTAAQRVTATPSRCPAAAPRATSTRLVVLCPTNGSAVGDSARLVVGAAGRTAVSATVWSADPQAAVPPAVSGKPAADGTVALALDVHGVPPGPVTVRVRASGGSRASEVVYLQLYRTGRRASRVPASRAARGHSLVYDEEFDRPVSLSRTGAGADYAAAKPTATGAEDFGFAIFADPTLGFGNVGVIDDSYLRIRVEPRPRGFADPNRWRRTYVGGLLASARDGGSGFSAQYGYFETRMATPAEPGTWPAFWLLSNTNLVRPEPVVPEIDAVELYGHDPTSACHTTHEYAPHGNGGVARCGTRFDSVRQALSWHTYGVAVGPTQVSYYIDGDLVATAPQVGGGGEPMFFLLDLALGGGWPIDLTSTRGRADLYVDYVRVYV